MLLFRYAYGQPVERHEVITEVTAAGLSRSGPLGPAPARDRYSDDVVIDGGVVTKEGRERIRPVLEAGRKALAAAGQLPPGVAPPPDAPA